MVIYVLIYADSANKGNTIDCRNIGTGFRRRKYCHTEQQVFSVAIIHTLLPNLFRKKSEICYTHFAKIGYVLVLPQQNLGGTQNRADAYAHHGRQNGYARLHFFSTSLFPVYFSQACRDSRTKAVIRIFQFYRRVSTLKEADSSRSLLNFPRVGFVVGSTPWMYALLLRNVRTSSRVERESSV